MKRLPFILLSILGLASCGSKPIEKPKKGNILLDIIEINDLHGYVNEAAKNKDYSLANIEYYIEGKRNKEDTEVLLIANGDMFEGTAFSNLSMGLSTLNVLNEMNFDMMGIGNHEFSWGLDSILQYFDGDIANGEANFPLINGNVYKDNNRYGSSENDNILPYTIVKKGDLNIGIVSYIGDVASSISSSKLEEYKIKADLDFFKTEVKKDCLKLKEDGADFIVFNIHGGYSDNILEYDVNQLVSNLKDDNGEYLIHAVINGHTHSRQEAILKREDNTLPLVQGGSYSDSFGEIVLEINLDEMKIEKTSSTVIPVTNIKKDNKDTKVQEAIDIEYNKIKNIVEESYMMNNSYITKENLGLLFSKDLRIGTSADISILNTGGIRQALDKGMITFSKIYDSYPFENHIICLKIKGKYIKDWIKKEAKYYYMDYDIDFIDDEIYKVSTIDYVYESSYFKNIILEYEFISESFRKTPRDYVISDLKNRGTTSFNINDPVQVEISEFGEF